MDYEKALAAFDIAAKKMTAAEAVINVSVTLMTGWQPLNKYLRQERPDIFESSTAKEKTAHKTHTKKPPKLKKPIDPIPPPEPPTPDPEGATTDPQTEKNQQISKMYQEQLERYRGSWKIAAAIKNAKQQTAGHFKISVAEVETALIASAPTKRNSAMPVSSEPKPPDKRGARTSLAVAESSKNNRS